MDPHWINAIFQTCPGGVSSAVEPILLPAGQYAWGFNAAVRGGKPHSRPAFIERLVLPSGLHQGSGYFGVQNGMLVASIAGRIYRLRVGNNSFSYELIPLGFDNSGVIRQSWMQQTVESLVIQDGQSDAIIYDGSTARRAGVNEVPRGRMMAYGNGRLWVAINANNLVAGDIRQSQPGSELKFTETNYLSGGGALYFPQPMTGLEFIPVTGAADFGTLIVFGADYAESIRADVTSRDQWAQMAGFVTNVFRDIGCAGDWAITQVNQDLYWRDSNGNIRSLANAISTSNSPGSTPISREVSRLVAYDSGQLLPFCSAIYFDNRLLMTASPYLNVSRGVSFKNLVALDFSPISTMQYKAPPAYDGQWTGIPGIAQLMAGKFNGKNRAFAISSGEDGVNRLWEIMDRTGDDMILTCGSGTITNYPIESFVEYPAVNFGSTQNRKRLERLDVWLSGLVSGLVLTAYWRTDNTQKWTRWDAVETCARTSDPSTKVPHTWKNLLPEQRPQIKTFTIPDGLDEVTKYALQVGFEFQVRLVWSGRAQIEKTMLYATPLSDPDYANRETLTAECIENDVTGNNIRYEIPACAFLEGCLAVTPPVNFSSLGNEGGPFTPATAIYAVSNTGGVTVDWTLTLSQAWLVADVLGGTLGPGESVNVTVSLNADALPADDVPYTGTMAFANTTNGCGNLTLNASLQVGDQLNMLMESRTIGGTAELCGFSEYIDPTVPPKKYRHETIGGSRCALDRGALTCTGDCDNQSMRVYSGDYSFDQDTCATTNNFDLQQGFLPATAACDCGTIVLSAGPQPPVTYAPVGGAAGTSSFFGVGNYLDTVDPTSWTREFLENCEDLGSVRRQTVGTLTLVLDTEDTDNDAITRLINSSSYTSWVTDSAKGDALTEFEARTAFSFNYQNAQIRLTRAGLAPTTIYSGTYTAYKRLWGTSDPWVVDSIVPFSAMTDGAGNFEVVNDLPTLEGYEVTAWDAGLAP